MKEKVVIGIPCGGTVSTRLAESLLNLQRFEFQSPDERYELLWVIFRSGLYIQENRNSLVSEARKAKADWLFQIDSDHSFDPTLLRVIMRTADKDFRPIIAGLYSNVGSVDNESFTVVDCIYKEAANGQYSIMSPTNITQPFEVDAAGTGLFLTHLSIFEKIEEPWFWLSMFQNKDGSEQMMNEDLSFCRLARASGYHIWVDPIAEAPHWKTIPLLPSTMRGFIEKRNIIKSQFEAKAAERDSQ